MSRVWFVTGASSGIGTGVVKAALAAGDRVVATARNVEKLRSAIGQPASAQLAFLLAGSGPRAMAGLQRRPVG